jgi:hypothetical protein
MVREMSILWRVGDIRIVRRGKILRKREQRKEQKEALEL